MSPLTEPTRLRLSRISVTTTDTNISNVSLLLHGDGPNGSTTITDTSYSPKTVTAFGDAKISTAQSKFGGASIAFDGVGDYLTVPSNAGWAFGTGNFTIESWVYLTQSQRHTLLAVGFQISGIAINIDSNGTIPPGPSIQICRSGTAVDNWFQRSIPLNTWFHLAICRSGSSVSAFYDGVQIGSSQTNSTNFAQGELVVGYDGNKVDFPFKGNLDELRITKGIARYTSNFTPPTAPYPDF